MAGFEILDEAEAAAPPTAAPGKGFVILDEPAPVSALDAAKDVAKSAGAGYLRGAAALAGAPFDLPRAIETGVRKFSRHITGQTPDQQEASLRENALGYGLKDVIPAFGSQSILSGLERGREAVAGFAPSFVSANQGPLHTPETGAGQVAHTLGEFVPGAIAGPGGVARKLLTGAVAPGLAAEGAGNLPGVKGTWLEPFARGGAAILGGGAATLATAPRTAEATLARTVAGQDQGVFVQAQQLMDDAAAAGVRLTGDEAIQYVTGNATRLGDLRRVIENSQGGGDVLKPLMAERPGQVSASGRDALASLAYGPQDPLRTGLGAQRAATTELADAQTAVNAATHGDYTAAGRQRLGAQVQQGLETDPLYVHHLNEVRNNPGLNRGIENLPNDSVEVVSLVQRRMREAAEAARMPGQANSSNLVAANLEDARSAPLAAAETVTGGRYGDYARARAAQGRLRQDFLEPLNQGPLGDVSRTADLAEQGRAVLPNVPAPGSERVVAETVGRIARQNPQAAQGVIRSHLESAFEEATQNLASGPNQFGGAKFAAAVAGNGQQARNLEAAITAAHGGNPEVYQGFRRWLDVMEATGHRPQMGSPTAFAGETIKDLKTGGVVGDAVTAAKTGGVALIKRFTDFRERLNLGENTAQIANILTRPDAARVLGQLAREPEGTARAGILALRLTYMGRQGLRSAGPGVRSTPSE
jgi:hypothetical protein